MKDYLIKFLNQLKEAAKKLTGTQKIIIISIVVTIGISFLFLISYSSTAEKVVLYSKLNAKEFSDMTKKLEEWGTYFIPDPDDKEIWVKPEDRAYIKMKLGQEGLVPQGIKGWDLFDTQKWTTTDFERNVNLKRAIIGEMTKHIMLLDDIEDVSIRITMPSKELYIDEETPWKASIIITPSPYSDILKNKKKIKGIVNLVAFGVDKLNPENVKVFDNHSNELSDFSEDEDHDYLKRAKEESKIIESLRNHLEDDIYAKLGNFIGKDYVDARVFLDIDFNQEVIEKTELLPTELVKDNPATPYDESKSVESITRSEKDLKEEFKGVGYVPEGAPGVDQNYPPGYKEGSDKYGHYTKNEIIKNYEIGERKTSTKRSPYIVKKVSVAVWVDGIWKKVYDDKGNLVINRDMTIKRDYIPRSDDELRKYEEIVKGSVGYNSDRKDMVVVKNVKFNWEEKWLKEDLAYQRKVQLRKTLIWALVTLFALFLGTIVYRAIMREIARRRRIREEELAMQQQLLREQAMRAAEEEGVEVELSLEEKTRLEMQQNAVNLAKERPEDVAALLRTWLSEE